MSLAIVWELGSGSSYAEFMSQLGREAKKGGCTCVFFACDLKIATARLTDDALGPIVQAPQPQPSHIPPVKIQTSYATLLHNNGFADAETLATRLQAWCALYEDYGISRVLARHSPTAILAARMMGLPVVHYGNSFSVPPDNSPWPSFRPDLKVPYSALLDREGIVLTTINSALSKLGRPSLPRLAAIFHNVPTMLLDYPELDSDTERRLATSPTNRYEGFPDINFGAGPDWPKKTAAPKLFASLLPYSAAEWVDVFSNLTALTILRYRDSTTPHIATNLPSHVVLTPPAENLNFKLTIAEARAVIGYGSHNLICEALLAGKPVAVIAHSPDELVLGLRVQALGVGILLPERPDENSIKRLSGMLEDQEMLIRAQAFSHRYKDQSRDNVATRLIAYALETPPTPIKT